MVEPNEEQKQPVPPPNPDQPYIDKAEYGIALVSNEKARKWT